MAFLDRLLEVTRRRLPELAHAITTKMGAPHDVSLGEQAATAVGHLEGVLTALEDFPWEERLPNGETLWREPVGVAGLITPWNWSINQITLKVLPAIGTGCACVLKPSELAPISAMLYAEILAEAGLPGGVVHLVNGTEPVVGAGLPRRAGMDMMSFTGSTWAGAQVSRDAAQSVKRVTLELGGKGPNLVFADVTPEMTIWREEVFGPVLTITPFEGEAEGPRLVNDTDYGLAAYVQPGARARALRAGMARVHNEAMGAGSPSGGMKRSGNGREGGRLGLEDFTEAKTLTLPPDWRQDGSRKAA